MKKLVDKINVIDVESTCWDKNPPPGEASEIIEVGICEVDIGELKVCNPRSFIIKPIHSKVGEFCTKLTTLTPEIVSAGQSFQSVLESLRTLYNSRERVWASYGDYDRRQFEKNCALYDGLPYPFGSRHLNIKTLVAMCKGWEEEIGMEQALGKMGLLLVGTHHRGGDDAANIAKILVEVLKAARRIFNAYWC